MRFVHVQIPVTKFPQVLPSTLTGIEIHTQSILYKCTPWKGRDGAETAVFPECLTRPSTKTSPFSPLFGFVLFLGSVG